MKNKVNGTFKPIMKTLFKIIGTVPTLFTISCLLAVVSAVLQVSLVATGQWLYDYVGKQVGTKDIGSSILIIVIFFFGLRVLNLIFSSLSQVFDTPMDLKMSFKLKIDLFKQVKTFEPLYFEDPENLLKLEKAKKGAEAFSKIVISFKWIIGFYLTYFLIMGVYLYSLRPVLTICIFLILIPMGLSQILHYYATKSFVDRSTIYAKQTDYFKKELTDLSYIKETQSLDLQEFIMDKYKKSNDKFYCESLRNERKSLLIQTISLFLYLVGYALSIWLLYDSLQKNYITIGGFAAIFASLGEILLFAHMFIKNYLKKLYQNFSVAKNYFTVFESDQQSEETEEIKLKNYIKLENVSFAYPKSDIAVLNNINLLIKENEKIAIVGENGAGKTTLAKVIIGLYKPTEGNVFYDDLNIYDFKSKTRLKNNSMVLQDFIKYKMTILENVTLKPNSGETAEVLNLFNSLQMTDERITLNLNSIVSKEFDGIELSGGQWQNIAIARGVYKNADLLILDEPTAALDPILESKILNKYAQISQNQTTIIITHRLASIKMVDRVLFLKNGQIVGFDTHQNLLKSSRDYYEMYMNQAKYYN